MKFIIFLVLMVSNIHAECVHEALLSGKELKSLNQQRDAVYVDTGDAIYQPVEKITLVDEMTYKVQILPRRSNLKFLQSYDSQFLTYYDVPRLRNYLRSKADLIALAGYDLRVVGKSIKGHDLYAITPKILTNKKTILMMGRQHGDEGTANWIIEGFLDEYLSNPEFRSQYQLLLYPMVNPDGAQAKTRYNSNGRDLNRSWHANSAFDFDEVKAIHNDLRFFINQLSEKVVIALDMHGSFSQDFFYRVDRNYVSLDFFEHQQSFIDELAKFDPWQRGQYILSNGDPNMARIVFINSYKYNTLTHETIRDIPLRNSEGRTIQTLKDQGVSLVRAISNQY
jgi:hypothetical protein